MEGAEQRDGMLDEGLDERIRIIITGGTFDKEYDPLAGELTFKDTHLPQILKDIRCTLPIGLEIQQLLDSLAMVDSDRQRILSACERSQESRIVITHGTDTMTQTAALLGSRKLDKVVILTGAMVPYSVTSSDAMFNLGTAIMACQIMPAGVYICMNGRCFPCDHVMKDRTRGIFTLI